MKVVVVGLGQVGQQVVRILESERHEVVAVDANPEVVRAVGEHRDVATLVG